MPTTSTARRFLAAIVLVLLAGGIASAPSVRAGSSNDHTPPSPHPTREGRVGVLLADHGEPPEYNAWTYESFREFFGHLIAMGVIPSWLTALETGTILTDADCPGCEEPSDAPRLIDAWLQPHDGPAVFVPASESLAAHYVLPGGPGLREPDIYEHVGLGAWHEWQRMGGRSPNYDEKLAKKDDVIGRLRNVYGDDLAIRVGYGIDPRIGGGRQGVREALDALVNRDRVDRLVVVYHGVGFSDIMQTHHLRHQIASHLDTLGRGGMPVRYAAPLGTTEQYVTAIVEKVRAELALVPADAPVAIHLSGHGLPTTTCGDYDCGADAYHRYSAELFARVRPAIAAAVDRPGRTDVFHVYGDGGEGDADPEDEAQSPIEALDARAADGGWTHVIDIPYEFDSNSRDTLIVLRQGYRRPQPDWNPAWESHFDHAGLQVKIANASGGEAAKTAALEAVTVDALGGPPPSPSPAPGDAPHGNEIHHAGTTAPRRSPAPQADAAVHVAHPKVPATPESGPDPHSQVHKARFDTIGAQATVPPHDVRRAASDAHTDGAPPAAAVGAAARDDHHRGGGGAGAGVGLAFGVAGGGALALGAMAGRRSVGGRLAAAGLGAQLAGLGWDVTSHAEAGQGVHLLENAGHWATMIGLLTTAAAAILLVRKPTASTPPG